MTIRPSISDWVPICDEYRKSIGITLDYEELAPADMKCHDELNVPECLYDGGDCCNKYQNIAIEHIWQVEDEFCENCTCYNVTYPTNQHYYSPERKALRSCKLALTTTVV